MFGWRKRERKPQEPFEAGLDQTVFVTITSYATEERYWTVQELQNFGDRLQIALDNNGQVQRFGVAGDVVVVPINGESADEMYAHIGRVLRHSSIAANARVTLQFDKEGSRKKHTHLAN